MNLDFRDLQLWYGLASEKNLKDYLQQIQSVRIAGSEGYKKVVESIKMELRNLKQGKPKVVQQNWDDLRSLGSGKMKKE